MPKLAFMSLHLIDVKCKTLREIVCNSLVCVILLNWNVTLLHCDTAASFGILERRDMSVSRCCRGSPSSGQNRLGRLISVSRAGRYVCLLFGDRSAQL